MMGPITWSYQPSESSYMITTAVLFQVGSACRKLIVLTMLRLKPPMNDPQVTPDPLSRSPMFLLPMVTWLRVAAEQTSPIGSGSPITVSEPSLPPLVSSPVPLRVAVTPLVWPETRLITPGVEGPNVVL